MSSQDSFHPFPRLPFEMRHAIWKLCVPHRVFDVDDLPWEEDLCIWREGKRLPITCRDIWKTSEKNALPPRIARVCREARAVAKERDNGIEEVDVWPWLSGKIRQEEETRHWFNPANDIVHMNVRNPIFLNLSGLILIVFGHSILNFLRCFRCSFRCEQIRAFQRLSSLLEY